MLPRCHGPDRNDCTTIPCAKNRGAYGWQFKEANALDHFAFFACSGANTITCSQKQIARIDPETDLVTINIGGNNGEAFAGVINWCIFFRKQANCSKALSNAQKVDEIEPDLVRLFTEISKDCRPWLYSVLARHRPTCEMPF